MSTRVEIVVGASLVLFALGASAAPAPQEELKELATITGHIGSAQGLAFSPDGKILASAGSDGLVKLWDVATAKEIAVLKGHKGRVFGVAFTPDGKTLASGGDDGMLRFWDVGARKEVGTRKAGQHQGICCLAISPDGKTIVSGESEHFVEGWRFDKEEPEFTNKVPLLVESTSLAFGPSGEVWALALKTKEDGKLIYALWDANTGKELVTLDGTTGAGYGVAFSRDRKMLATGGAKNTNTAAVWSVKGGKQLTTLKFGEEVTCVGFNPDGKILACGTQDDDHRKATIHLNDVATGKELAALTGHTRTPYCAVFSPDGRTLATSTVGQIKLWRIPSTLSLKTATK